MSSLKIPSVSIQGQGLWNSSLAMDRASRQLEVSYSKSLLQVHAKVIKVLHKQQIAIGSTVGHSENLVQIRRVCQRSFGCEIRHVDSNDHRLGNLTASPSDMLESRSYNTGTIIDIARSPNSSSVIEDLKRLAAAGLLRSAGLADSSLARLVMDLPAAL